MSFKKNFLQFELLDFDTCLRNHTLNLSPEHSELTELNCTKIWDPSDQYGRPQSPKTEGVVESTTPYQNVGLRGYLKAFCLVLSSMKFDN